MANIYYGKIYRKKKWKETMNIKIWDGKPLGRIEEFRDISTDSPTTIEHFYDYLLKLKNTMNFAYSLGVIISE